MIQVSLGRRYGKAIYELLREEGNLEQAMEQLGAVSAGFTQDEELKTILHSPKVTRSMKVEAVRALAEQIGMGDTLRNFLCLLAERGRLSVLPDILRSVEHYYYTEQNILPAEVASASELKGENLDSLKSLLEGQFGKSIKMSHQVDPELIGGLRIRVGSMLIDGSLRAQLNKVRRTLLER